MANPNLADMTEEDAADLQFPKGKINKSRLRLTYKNFSVTPRDQSLT